MYAVGVVLLINFIKKQKVCTNGKLWLTMTIYP